MSLQLIAAEHAIERSYPAVVTDVERADEVREDHWMFCVGCAIAVPAPALHQHLRICSGTTSA